EALGDRPAEPAARARHQRHLSFEYAHEALLRTSSYRAARRVSITSMLRGSWSGRREWYVTAVPEGAGSGRRVAASREVIEIDSFARSCDRFRETRRVQSMAKTGGERTFNGACLLIMYVAAMADCGCGPTAIETA